MGADDIRHTRDLADFLRLGARTANLVALAVAIALLAGCGSGANLCSKVSTRGGTTALSAPFASAIPLGAAVRWDRVKDSPGYARFYLSHYTWMTPENELKMAALEPEEGQFDFSSADAIVKWAVEHGKHVHGHTLIWGTDLPGWAASLGKRRGAKARADAIRALGTYVVTVVKHFRANVHEWDAVNEAIEPTGRYVKNAWDKAIGPGYIKDAFVAAKLADPSVRLCYNDSGLELPGAHADRALALVKQLRAAHLIDCVGFELHLGVPGPPEAALQEQIKKFAATGVEVLIAELDVSGAAIGTPPALAAQAAVYGNVARACRAVSGCARITTWGFTDASSWLGTATRALPFDSDCVATPAWRALRNALNAR